MRAEADSRSKKEEGSVSNGAFRNGAAISFSVLEHQADNRYHNQTECEKPWVSNHV